MANIIEGETKITGNLRVGNATNPPAVSGGSGAISTTNKADSSLHLRTDSDTLPEVMHNSAAEKLGFGQHCVECRMATLTANQANTHKTYLPRKCKIVGVSRRFTLKPASSGGTVVTGITVGGDQILASASEDEEGITNDTLTAHNLTATSADLLQAKGAPVIITVTSDNGDMTDGTDPMFYLYYEDN